MKILYVEDQLSKQVDTILTLFSQVLGKNLKKELRDLIKDPSGRGASAEEIKEIVGKSNRLDLSDSFPDALRKITHHYGDYELFIVDRNLAEVEYDFSDIQKIDKNLTEERLEKYWDWEGDWLLNVLVHKKIDVRNQFYFLTGYTGEEIKSENINHLIEQNRFNISEQLVKKGELEQLDYLKKRINQNLTIKLCNENKDIVDILQSKLGDEAVDDFIDILKNNDNVKYINEIRQFYENHILKGMTKIKEVDHNKCYHINKKTGKQTNHLNLNGF